MTASGKAPRTGFSVVAGVEGGDNSGLIRLHAVVRDLPVGGDAGGEGSFGALQTAAISLDGFGKSFAANGVWEGGGVHERKGMPVGHP